MAKRYGLFLTVLTCCLIFSGSAKKTQRQTIPNIVVKIEASCQWNGIQLNRTYTNPQKTTPILQYLRLLKSKGFADTDPELLTGARFEIKLHFANGQINHYRQYSNRFLSRNTRAWERVDSQYVQFLYPILEAMPSD